ncbi:MAG: polyketide beta-ketoacyl:ACP synthase [Chloroflexi bacterium]|nr:MAG: polyketide beta-ketoacyl:ACP synthase [Chloroflexota bacterium]
MKNPSPSELLITGLGVTSAIGQGKTAFTTALLQGQQRFAVMQRAYRQRGTAFLGAELPSLLLPDRLSKRLIRTASFSGQVALATLHEAWEEAKLDAVDPQRIGLVVGGSNIGQREVIQTHDRYADRLSYLRPTYGLSFLDSDLCGLCTEQFGIRGLAYTVGGASASGHVSLIQASQAVLTGQVDICIALGALMDLSYLELQALRTLGAMGTDKYANAPTSACRPFDKNRDGFLYGEACGAVVIERASTAMQREISPYAVITGWAITIDGHRNPNPSYDGEVQVIQRALQAASLSADEVDYINPHGTGSIIGDETELQALRDCQLCHAYVNTTKSLTGHGLSAAGTVEVIATLLQMQASQLHPSLNLEDPIDPSFNWVLSQPISHSIEHALNLSMGFGGLNTAICLQRATRQTAMYTMKGS